jgi:hypothetical protein
MKKLIPLLGTVALGIYVLYYLKKSGLLQKRTLEIDPSQYNGEPSQTDNSAELINGKN